MAHLTRDLLGELVAARHRHLGIRSLVAGLAHRTDPRLPRPPAVKRRTPPGQLHCGTAPGRSIRTPCVRRAAGSGAARGPRQRRRSLRAPSSLFRPSARPGCRWLILATSLPTAVSSGCDDLSPLVVVVHGDRAFGESPLEDLGRRLPSPSPPAVEAA